MDDQKSVAPPDYIYTIHPGAGQCGLQGLKKQGFIPETKQYVYRCRCGFQWLLSWKEVVDISERSLTKRDS